MYTSINLNIIYTDFCEKENKTQCAADKISNFYFYCTQSYKTEVC